MYVLLGLCKSWWSQIYDGVMQAFIEHFESYALITEPSGIGNQMQRCQNKFDVVKTP